MTPDFILRTHNDGKGEVDVDSGDGHGDNWGRTLREEEWMIDGGKGKAN